MQSGSTPHDVAERSHVQGSELRLEVKEDATVSVMVRALAYGTLHACCAALLVSAATELWSWYAQLTAGQAEIFGTTLITGQALTLRGHKVAVSAQSKPVVLCAILHISYGRKPLAPAHIYHVSPLVAARLLHAIVLHTHLCCAWAMKIYTWDGCTVDVITEDYPIAMATDMVYTSDETPMVSYLNTHQARGASQSPPIRPTRLAAVGLVLQQALPGAMWVCSSATFNNHADPRSPHHLLLPQALHMRRDYASQTGATGPRAVVCPPPHIE